MTVQKVSRAVKSRLRGLIEGRRVKIRESDVFLVSYPRSGNTWVRFLLANVVESDAEQPIDFPENPPKGLKTILNRPLKYSLT